MLCATNTVLQVTGDHGLRASGMTTVPSNGITDCSTKISHKVPGLGGEIIRSGRVCVCVGGVFVDQ